MLANTLPLALASACRRPNAAVRIARILPSVRSYSTDAPFKPSVKLIARLRRENEDVSMSLAKQALTESNNDYDLALAWLNNHAAQSGASKAAKLAGREANDGLVAVVDLPLGAAMVEVNSETDFVARTDVFKDLAHRCALTAHFLAADAAEVGVKEVPVDVLTNAPILPDENARSGVDAAQAPLATVSERIVECIGALGENISVRRAATAATPDPTRAVAGAYVHGDKAQRAAGIGRIGAIAVLSGHGLTADHAKLAQQIAQVVVGFNPPTPRELLSAPFAAQTKFLTPDGVEDVTVAKVLEAAKADVKDYLRFQIGE
ncbi:elongation factor TS-domain-containing protein [Catenaria anguillulae PL171]|uniref:Elongation factor Ts, mitochondrial n=1 Tax=Catenaria anguillulae PL171 TaxID=765915 RepID=A0A1Y2H6P0_9FUNG|nr:elongation factor TS-domain-containing protein [Catenaria anguillulae PL171]